MHLWAQNHTVDVYDVIGAKLLNKKVEDNASNLVCKIDKIQDHLQRLCLNSRTYLKIRN